MTPPSPKTRLRSPTARTPAVATATCFFLGKAITVRSASGDPDTCIVDCEDSSNGFYFVDDEGADSVLEGLTIANGHFYEDIYSGAGVCIWESSPTLNNCTIRGSSIGGTSIGAGVICIRSSAVLNNCRIIDNVAGFEGGGVAFHDSNATLMYCTISGNTAGQAGGGVDFRSKRYVDADRLPDQRQLGGRGEAV